MFQFKVINQSDDHVKFRVWAGKDIGSLEDRGLMVLKKEEFEELKHNMLSSVLLTDVCNDIDKVLQDGSLKNLLKARISATFYYHKIASLFNFTELGGAANG